MRKSNCDGRSIWYECCQLSQVGVSSRMAWINRLIDSMPDTPEGVGALAMLGGVGGMGVALMLANLPLAIGAAAVWVAGCFAPALYAMRETANPPATARSAAVEAQEDAAVDAFVLRMEAEGRYQAMVAQRTPATQSHPLSHGDGHESIVLTAAPYVVTW